MAFHKLFQRCFFAAAIVYLSLFHATAWALPGALAAEPRYLYNCQLFRNGGLAEPDEVTKVIDYKSVFEFCRVGYTSGPYVAIRDFHTAKGAYVVLVDPQPLQTFLFRRECLLCEPGDWGTFAKTAYGKAVGFYGSDRGLTTIPGSGNAHKSSQAYQWAGLRSFSLARGGVAISADLCPSHRPLDRGFFSELQRQQLSPPVALAVSGAWMQSHRGDLEWIKSQQRAGLIQVTWVNHSYSHPFVKALPDEENYLLKKGVKISREILETERLMIEQGITPSVFFRFPGLVSDAHLMAELRAHQLIPLATNAWLALDQKPKPGSIVLVHANGNEPRGLEKLRAIANQKKLPTPLCDLNESLRETLSKMAKPGDQKHQDH